MSTSAAGDPASAAPEKPRIRTSTSKSFAKPTPVRQSHDFHPHEISPTPLRAHDRKCTAPSLNSKNTALQEELSPRVLSGLRQGDLEFPINEECTSLKILPNGSLVVAGFTDGTLRLFDLEAGPSAPQDEESFSCDGSEDELSFETAKKNATVCSKAFQRYGKVACQIYARGVHTSLIMHVDCSEDSLYCFGGVLRGSMELVAVDLSKMDGSGDILDVIQVHRHNDAKLKGFGACTRLKGKEQTYLLLTGKGIKNIHIWSFRPKETNAWQCLYDTQTNGNTISILHLRYDANGLLQALSKSDLQKLRVWDLSHEQHGGDKCHPLYTKKSTIQQLAKKSVSSKERPKRPPYVDVANTESCLGLAGEFSFCGGCDQVSVVSLNVENVASPFNHTEMALPGCGTSRRRQRGDLQSIVRVAGMTNDASHVLMELSNGSVVHYSSDPQKSASRLQAFSSFQWEEGSSRNLCVERIGSYGLVVAAMSTYYATSGRGSIVLRPVDANDPSLQSPIGDKRAIAAANVCAEEPSPNQSVQLFDATPKATEKTKKKKRRVVGDIPRDMISAKKNEAARVSLDGTAGEYFSTMAPRDGVAVSPEQIMHISTAPKQKSKKKGAMLKYLCPANEAKLSSKPAGVPRKLHQEAGTAKAKNIVKGLGDTKLKALVSVLETPLKEKTLNETEKLGRKMEHTPNGNALDKATKQKRVKSPCVPRKRQFQQSGSSQFASKKTPKKDSLLEVAEALCDIRRGTPSPKRARPSTGRFTRSMTPVREERPSHPHRKRPKSLANQLPTTSILERIGGIESSKTDIQAKMEASRMKLAAEHRAGHEFLKKRVFFTVDTIIRSLTRPDPISDGEARTWFNDEIKGFREMLEDMMARQKMEASVLATEQSMQQKGAPELQVSFPFPDIFDSATSVFERFLLEEKALA